MEIFKRDDTKSPLQLIIHVLFSMGTNPLELLTYFDDENEMKRYCMLTGERREAFNREQLEQL